MMTSPNSFPDFVTLTAQEVAKILNVSTKTLETWRRTESQNLPFIRIGRAIRYIPSDVSEFLKEKRHCASG
ncbi:MAG: helix-turn-helix domain-containing protein [Bacteroidales bacterium]|nr:helix-turn-helix domain-containing protein [Candidatus Latescibacterota bacterium]